MIVRLPSPELSCVCLYSYDENVQICWPKVKFLQGQILFLFVSKLLVLFDLVQTSSLYVFTFEHASRILLMKPYLITKFWVNSRSEDFFYLKSYSSAIGRPFSRQKKTLRRCSKLSKVEGYCHRKFWTWIVNN